MPRELMPAAVTVHSNAKVTHQNILEEILQDVKTAANTLTQNNTFFVKLFV
jgi:hypothetical protein